MQQPERVAKANSTDDLTNSWPRWSPFVQTYADGSKRDYGIELQQPAGVASQRPQLWMSSFAPAAAS
ncbi:MAG: hypothetical protein ABI321_09570 [Polyangia bacterium]